MQNFQNSACAKHSINILYYSEASSFFSNINKELKAYMIQFDEDHIVIDRTRIFLFLHMHISILSQTPLPSRLPYNIKQGSKCYTVGPCWLSILNIAVCTCPSQIL